ncbi:MAG: DNA polymerase III subunit delta [Acidobacteria bacterium RIFCSPLOWO2_02_FULL_61_28]|nr:MAG: DNA polymerase III subunit delta [Acidobacteria bacterium RIFCSPLOWO2_02_FULL_61_28]
MRLPAARALELIEAGKLSAGYILLGNKIYWRDRIIAALRAALRLDPVAMGISEFDLRADSLSRVIEAARERSLLSPRQLLIVRNAQALTSRRRGEAEDQPVRGEKSPKRSDELAAYFRDPNPYSVIVLEMMDVDLDTDDWREREKVQARLESFGNLCDVALLAAPSFGEAMQLVQAEATGRGHTIDPEAAEQLLAAFDRDMGRVRMELDKLCLYDPGKKRIEAEDLNVWGSGLAEGGNLALTEALGSHDPKKALEALAEVERSGRYAPLVVLEITRYFRQLILLKEKKVREPRQAANSLWAARLPAPQGSLPKMLEQARSTSGRVLLRALRLAYEAEVALRSGPPEERIILERFVLQLMRPSQNPAVPAGAVSNKGDR